MKKLLLLFLFPVFCLAQPTKEDKKHRGKDYLVTLTTDLGVMHIILYDQTPQHKANFIKLVDQKFYDGLLFHRIIQNFMIQGGDPNSRTAKEGDPLGNGDTGYTIPAEFVPTFFHKKALYRPPGTTTRKRRRAGASFILSKAGWDDEGLGKQIERIKLLNGRLPTEEQKQVYKTLGGTPYLDGNYTVFGEVLNPPTKEAGQSTKKPGTSPISVTKPTMQISTPTGQVGTPTGGIGVPGGQVGVPSAKVALPTGKVGMPTANTDKANRKSGKAASKTTGLAVVDSIARQPRNPADRPLMDIHMTVAGEWVKKKKITKKFGYKFL